jgi:hypothetical protein
MLEAAFDTAMRTEVWGKLPGGVVAGPARLATTVGDGVPQGLAGGVIWSTRMLGLLRVMVGTRVGREGGVLGEWGGGTRGAMYPQGYLVHHWGYWSSNCLFGEDFSSEKG